MKKTEQLKNILNFELWNESCESVRKDILAFNPNHGTFMIDHLSEWNGGWPPIPADPNQLPIGNSQKSLAGQNSAFIGPQPEAIQLDLEPIKEANTSHKETCSCSSRDLLWIGCKCGGI